MRDTIAIRHTGVVITQDCRDKSRVLAYVLMFADGGGEQCLELHSGKHQLELEHQQG